MAATEPASGGVTGSFRRLVSSIAGLLHARFELFAVELQEEKLRAVGLLIWIGAGFAFGIAGVLLAVGTLALYLWEKAGYAGLGGLAAVSLAAAIGVFVLVRSRIRHGPVPFAATTEEFRRDLDNLRPPE